MKMKKVLICEKGHKFGEQAKFDVCPFCKSSLSFKWEGYETRLKNYFLRRQTKVQIHDNLPRLPWFGEMIEINDEKQNKNRKKWDLDEVQELKEHFKCYGIVDAVFWKDMAENIFGRSLCSIEHILRFIVADNFGFIKLEDVFS